MLQAAFLESIDDIEPHVWDGLFDSPNPFIRHAFLRALEHSGCASSKSGWAPQHLLIQRDGEPVAAMPLYLKSHSYGEFVFDWGWAEAFERHGLNYYPKLLTAIPFTPSAGPRFGVSSLENRGELLAFAVEQVQRHAKERACSSWHLLFPDEDLSKLIDQPSKLSLLHRQDVQFYWMNRGYADFAAFLTGLRSSRRKNLQRERRSIAATGVTLERKAGEEISAEDWSVFYQCYCDTYLKRSGHAGYLNQEFFNQLLEHQHENLMLVVARRKGAIIANALFLFDQNRLYGRYWGALVDIPFLHFEACLYQGIEFCIERGISSFDPGTQGEHKLLRGFEPVTTCSWHWISDPRFRAAIGEFLLSEKVHTRAYGKQAAGFLPFKKDQDPN